MVTIGFVEKPQSFKIFFAKHNLSSFKFSTKVWERAMLVNTPISEAYKILKRKYFCFNISVYKNDLLLTMSDISENLCFESFGEIYHVKMCVKAKIRMSIH